MKTILNVKNLTKNFGGLCAVSNVSMTINVGELIGLIGPNGAGKTTLFNLLTGVYEPSSGLIELMDQDKSIQIGGLKPYKITNLGVARTFQNIRLFKSMTVLENVKVAMHKNIRYGTLAAILRLPTYYKEEKWVEEKAEELLKEKDTKAKLAFVGDGINDAPSLKSADIGVSVASGTDIANNSSDIILMNNDLSNIVKLFRISKFTFKIIGENLFWAFIYNIGMIIISIGILPITNNPMIAAFAMTLSSITVSFNSLRILKLNKEGR